MNIYLVAVGNRMPAWVKTGFEEYANRLPAHCALKLIEVPLAKRTKASDINRIIQAEGERIIAAIPKACHVVALDRKGTTWSTEQLSEQLGAWLQQGMDVGLLIGGPDGLSKPCLQRSNQKWSLSALTLPHPLVRVVVAEQIYRSWSILNHHPYHK